jgi:hypothetical protein
MSLLPLFRWASQTPIFAVMRNSKWGFALVEMVHLLALASFGGTLLVIDLGVLGIGLRLRPISKAARSLSRLFLVSLVLTAVSGALLVSAEAMKCYYHPAFRVKMLLLVLALTFNFTLHRKLVETETDAAPTAWSKLSAIVSLALWFSVGVAGRTIGFL